MIEHRGEDRSNDIRRRAARAEPQALRTFTPSLAVIERAAGCYLWTPEGRKLADFTSGVLVANLGHNPERWWGQVCEHMKLPSGLSGCSFVEAVPLTAYNALTEIEIMAAERLLANLRSQPGGARCEQVLWAASGSEAIQKALWSALAPREGQDIILATRGGFHGKKGLAGAVSGNEKDRERDSRVRFISFPTDECRSVARCREPLDLDPYRTELDRLWKEHGARICALITEPYLGGGGSYHPQPEYLQLLARFCREHDIVLIFDEIQSNFGRTGSMYAFTHYGIEPDIVCLGKGMGNGVPVAAAVGRADLFGRLSYGEGSDTWSANPLSCAAVVATLDEFESGDVLEHARRLSAVIERGLLRLAELPCIAAVRGEGVVWGIECAATGRRSASEVAAEIVKRCYLGDAAGRAIHLLGPLAGRVIRVSPPLVMPLDEAEQYLEAMYGMVSAIGTDEFTVKIGATDIEDTFAEAFRMVYARLIVTAHDEYWLNAAAAEFCGYSTSIIACDCEAGVEHRLSMADTPDGRPGAAIMVFGFSPDALLKVLINRVGQCLMTCPTTAVYDGLPEAPVRSPLGKSLRYFGDGFQKSKVVGSRRYWRVPVMDGEFLVEESVGVEKGIGGGNIILQAASLPLGLAAARRGAEALRDMPGVIAPFPGGVARSGSKIGSRYKGLRASTADAFCPTLRTRVETKLHAGANCVYEIVIDGTSEATVGRAIAAAARAAAGDGIIAITAGNYGGKLGKFHFHLRKQLDGVDASPLP